METLSSSCSSTIRISGHKLNSFSRNGFTLFLPFSSQNMGFNLSKKSSSSSVVIMASKNNNNNNEKKKEDRHSFVAKPDESAGIFPESVLLRLKVVQEDGQLLPEFADAEELLPEFANAEERELYEALNLMMESDLDEEQNRHYEVVYLIHENFKEEVEKVNLKIQDFIGDKKGRVHRLSDWGLRRLAYKIQKAKNAHYILMNFEIDAKWINDFKSMLDKDERIIRHLVMKQYEAITEECTPPPEFHTLRADMDGDEYDDDDDDEYDDEYDDDDDDDESDVTIDNGDDPGIIYVDADEDQENDKDRKPESLKIGGRRKLEKARKF